MIVVAVKGEGFVPSARLSLLFSPDRRAKIARLTTPEGRAQSACAEMAYMLCCLRALGEIPAYRYGFNGKPEFADAVHGYFSLSHAGPYGLCAISAQPVGADIESARRDLTRMARRVRAEGDAETDLNLLWCAKESYVKLTGEGLSHPFPALALRAGVIHDPEGKTLACVASGQLDDFLWCVCTREEEPPHLFTFSAAQAEETLLARFFP